ncbi:ABC-2 type transport system permease protein [Frankineae bacterium MT45]|nr:ABC-2 type transport system permease protein [Frankineae bacterium MT45]
MSAAEASDTAQLAGRELGRARPLAVLRLLRSEVAMTFRRRRNLAILAVLGALPIVIAIAVRSTTQHPSRGGGGGDNGGALFNSITENGVFVAFAALAAVLTFFLPLAVAVVAGDSIAGEANTGTLRYLLTVPVGRTRLLVVKYVGILIWCLVSVLLVAVIGVLIGVALFGGGRVTLLSGTTVTFAAGLYRLLLVVLYLSWMMAAVGAIGLFVSTLTEVPVASMAATLALVITSEVLDAVPQLRSIHAWLPSHYWLQFADLLRDPMDTSRVQHGCVVGLVYVALFLTLSWARFSNKDVTS